MEHTKKSSRYAKPSTVTKDMKPYNKRSDSQRRMKSNSEIKAMKAMRQANDGEPIFDFGRLKNIVAAAKENSNLIENGWYTGGWGTDTVGFNLIVIYHNKRCKILLHYHPKQRDPNYLHAKVFPPAKEGVIKVDERNIMVVGGNIHDWLLNKGLLSNPYPN